MPAVQKFESGLISGLINYFGGKRKIAKLIAKFSIGKKFTDLFFGGGSVGLYMKAQGFEVSACDRSYLSSILGKSLLQNDFKKISPYDLHRLFMHQDSNVFTTQNYYPNLFTQRHASWIDDAIFAAEQVRDETSRYLLKLVVAKVIFSIRAFGAFTNQLYMQEWNEKNEEAIMTRSPSYYKNLSLTLWEMAEKAMTDINASIFANGKLSRFYPCDIFDFLALREPTDTIYLDPPYYGSQNYEAYYSIVNKILTGGIWHQPDISMFNSKEKYFETIERVLAECSHIPRLMFSYGGYRGIEEKNRLVEAIRTKRGAAVQLIEIPYSYSIHRTGDNGNGNHAAEILIVSDL